MKTHFLLAAFVAVLLALPAAAADVEPAQSPVPASADTDAGSGKAPLLKRSRLRFRGNGPTCMCADGLSEKDIRAAAERAREIPTQSTDQQERSK